MDETSRMTKPFWEPAKISFENLRHEDLPLIHGWLNRPHVKRWWGSDGTAREEVFEKYGAYIDAKERVRAFERLPTGYVQTYRISDEPEYSEHLGLDCEAAGVDLFIGEEDYVHKGLGAIILQRFLAEFVFADETIDACVIGPEPANTTAIKAYEKAGFRHLKTLQVPGEDNPEYLMVITRADFSGLF